MEGTDFIVLKNMRSKLSPKTASDVFFGFLIAFSIFTIPDVILFFLYLLLSNLIVKIQSSVLERIFLM